jgi:HK97 gp10 family phage protein
MAYDKNKMLEIFGTEELVNLFNEIESEATDVIVNQSFRKAGNLIKDALSTSIDEAGIKSDSKHKYKFKNTPTTSLRKSEKRLIIGIRKKGVGALAPILEKGTTERYLKSGRSTGSVKATHFFENSIEKTEEEVKELISNDLTTRLNKLIKKRNKLKK